MTNAIKNIFSLLAPLPGQWWEESKSTEGSRFIQKICSIQVAVAAQEFKIYKYMHK